jgi:hypothetical protein
MQYVQYGTFSTSTLMRFALHSGSRKIRLLPLVAATYFMVSGGPYGIEDILGGAGYAAPSSSCSRCRCSGACPPPS